VHSTVGGKQDKQVSSPKNVNASTLYSTQPSRSKPVPQIYIESQVYVSGRGWPPLPKLQPQPSKPNQGIPARRVADKHRGEPQPPAVWRARKSLPSRLVRWKKKMARCERVMHRPRQSNNRIISAAEAGIEWMGVTEPPKLTPYYRIKPLLLVITQ
jgi:hypothetical protein